MFARLEEEGIDPVVFGFTDIGWQQLQFNMQLNNKQIQNLRFQLEQYKKYYEGEQTKKETASKQRKNNARNTFRTSRSFILRQMRYAT